MLLCLGLQEGPMIHSGAICASGMSRGEFHFGKKTWKPAVSLPPPPQYHFVNPANNSPPLTRTKAFGPEVPSASSSFLTLGQSLHSPTGASSLFYLQCCNSLRSDEERRDFVAAGAASGVSAAFASPVGRCRPCCYRGRFVCESLLAVWSQVGNTYHQEQLHFTSNFGGTPTLNKMSPLKEPLP